jgi:ATP-dependent Clp protease ATP-binding subunit ClpA
VHDNPSTLILLDEFEKAHPMILNLFLQVLEDGRLTDNQGKTVSFRNSIIIATSNAGSQMISEAVQRGVTFDKSYQQEILHTLQEKNLFKPELLNRFDEVIIFQPLGMEEGKQIAKLLLDSLVKQLAQEDIIFYYDEKVLEKVVAEGMNTEYGARPLKRYIQSTMQDMIAEKKLKGELQRGNTLALSVDSANNFAAQIQ